MSFSRFLEALPPSLDKQDGSPVHITAGNQSCDLDSIASSLAHAHYIATTQEGVVSIPLLLCNREDLALRTDATWLLSALGIDHSKLVCADKITSEWLSGVGQLSVTLVDHSRPTGVLANFSSAVREVIDHHKVDDEEEVGGVKRESRVEAVGSCSTLVAEKLLDEKSYAVEGTVATLLLAAILIDTVDLCESEGRVTEKDTAIAEKLIPLSTIARSELFQQLFEARFNISSLTTPQLLRKDFKLATAGPYTLGFSSITALLSDFLLPREHLTHDLDQFCEAHGIHILLLLGISVDKEKRRRRQIAIYQPHIQLTTSLSADFVDSVASVLEAEDALKCERMTEVAFDGALLEQHNTAMSRKHIMPTVTHFLASTEHVHPNFQVCEDQQQTAAPTGSLDHPNFMAAEHGSTAAVLTVSADEHSAPLEPTVTVVTPPKKKSQEAIPPIPEYTPQEEAEQSRKFRFVNVGGEKVTINMTTVQPYRKIIQHAGYIQEDRRAVVVISACYLPPHSLPNYSSVLHDVFFYVLFTLDKLIVDNYIIVYLHSGAPRHSMPSVSILHKFYEMVDRRLRKQLQHLYIVHPSFWVKTMLRLARPLISGKFYRKVHFIRTLADLSSRLSLEEGLIPAPVVRADAALHPRQPPQQKYKPGEDKSQQGV